MSELTELLAHLEDSLDSPVDDTVERVTVPPEFAEEVTECLHSKGELELVGQYILNQKVEVYKILAALGFRLPVEVALDGKYLHEHFMLGLKLAMRYTLKNRRRLDTPRTLDELANLILNSSKVMVITGAGISTSLGIPDFRSDDGLYAKLSGLGLNDPQEVFDIHLFKEDPSIFYSVAPMLLPVKGLHSGTPTHKFIKLLNDNNKLLRNYTQNIDNLERFVGIPDERVVQCHGSIGSFHCITCNNKILNGETLFDEIKQGEIPKCRLCQNRNQSQKKRKLSKVELESDTEQETESASYGVLKPDITFFGEAMPDRFDEMLFDEGDAFECDLVLCLGTSLRVSPVNQISSVISNKTPQVYISKTKPPFTFEMVFLGGCDDVVELLCEKLGWDLNHPMQKRTKDMPDTEFPGGVILNDDGVYRFIGEGENISESGSESDSGSDSEEKSESEKSDNVTEKVTENAGDNPTENNATENEVIKNEVTKNEVTEDNITKNDGDNASKNEVTENAGITE